MKTVAALLTCLFLSQGDSLFLMFWNLENYFDWKRDTRLDNPSEAGFSSGGSRHWTRRRFARKSNAIAKSILWIADGRGLPDIIGVAEVENRFVLEKLLEETPLRRAGYGIVHFDSPDPRGIDVAMLYRRPRVRLLSAVPLAVADRSRDGPATGTRDILLSVIAGPDGDTLAVLVNHHPSKYGGGSSRRRETAMARLADAVDSLESVGLRKNVAMGDFNDIPEAVSAMSRNLVNLALPLSRRGEGTIRYSGKWELIDMFLVSPSLAGKGLNMETVRIPFLSRSDNVHSGEKPLRTYEGPRYLGGVSDHRPVLLKIPCKSNGLDL